MNLWKLKRVEMLMLTWWTFGCQFVLIASIVIQLLST